MSGQNRVYQAVEKGSIRVELMEKKAHISKIISLQEHRLKPVLGDNPDRSDLAQAYANQERIKSLLVRAKDDLTRIEKALENIDSDNYGVCASCQRPIPQERLTVLPHAVFCIDCKSKKEGNRIS